MVSAYNVALIYAALGWKDAAFAWLEKSFSKFEHRMLFFMYDPHLDLLCSDPRFESLLQRHGLSRLRVDARR